MLSRNVEFHSQKPTKETKKQLVGASVAEHVSPLRVLAGTPLPSFPSLASVDPVSGFGLSRSFYLVGIAAVALAVGTLRSGEKPAAPPPRPKLAFVIQPRDLADDLHAVVAADREVYTRLMANTLSRRKQTSTENCSSRRGGSASKSSCGEVTCS